MGLDDYVQVHERVRMFRDEHPEYGLVTEILHQSDKRIVVRASVYDDCDPPRLLATGHAEEARTGDFDLEKGETSAVGRALGFLGFGITAGIASAEEMAKVEKKKAASPKLLCTGAYLHQMAAELGLDDAGYRAALELATGKTSSKELVGSEITRAARHFEQLIGARRVGAPGPGSRP